MRRAGFCASSWGVVTRVACMQGASSHVDVSQRKLCTAALVKLLKVWGGEEWFKQYAIDSIGLQCCVGGMVSGGVDVRDGGVLGLLTEVLLQPLIAVISTLFTDPLSVDSSSICNFREVWLMRTCCAPQQELLLCR